MLVPQGVADAAKVLDAQGYYRRNIAGSASPEHCLLDTVEKHAPAGQVGERIVKHEMVELFGLLAGDPLQLLDTVVHILIDIYMCGVVLCVLFRLLWLLMLGCCTVFPGKNAVSAVLLCPVQGIIRFLDQVFLVGNLLGEAGKSKAGGNADGGRKC